MIADNGDNISYSRTGGKYCDEEGMTAPADKCEPGYYCNSGVDSKTPSFTSSGNAVFVFLSVCLYIPYICRCFYVLGHHGVYNLLLEVMNRDCS